jgi:mRNA interferase MazF
LRGDLPLGDERSFANGHFIIAPVTSRGREGYPTRVRVAVQDIVGFIVLDQIRAIDRSMLCERIGVLDAEEIMEVKSVIKEMLVD